MTHSYVAMEDEFNYETKSFEERMGCSVYDVLPNIGKTTLLNPKPWMPSK